jgi:hypothetical protein
MIEMSWIALFKFQIFFLKVGIWKIVQGKKEKLTPQEYSVMNTNSVQISERCAYVTSESTLLPITHVWVHIVTKCTTQINKA